MVYFNTDASGINILCLNLLNGLFAALNFNLLYSCKPHSEINIGFELEIMRHYYSVHVKRPLYLEFRNAHCHFRSYKLAQCFLIDPEVVKAERVEGKEVVSKWLVVAERNVLCAHACMVDIW